jgi:predicted transcriptional regulator
MKKPSLSDQLTERFRTKPGQWIPGSSIERWVLSETEYTASNARRRLRELVEAGVLMQEERSVKGVNHAFYCYNPEKTTAPKKKYRYQFDPATNTMIEIIETV